MSTKFAKMKILGVLLVAGAAVLAGCGGGSSSNVVTIAVFPTVNAVIVTQSATITATVSGTTNTNVTWACTYVTQSFDSKGNETDGSSQPCSADTGNIPANSANATVVFSAPQSVPDPTKLPGTNCTGSQSACLLSISVKATAAADTKKTAAATVSVISGIAVQLTPITATVPTSNSSCQLGSTNVAGCSQFQFSAAIQNDINSKGVTWLVTQGTPTTTSKGTVINYPELTTCSPGCGSVDKNGLYSAPATVPTTATLTIVVSSNADISQFAIGTITIVQGQPITFNGISPTIAPQNAVFYDIYLDAPNVTSASTVTVKGDKGTTKVFNFASGQLKVLFPIPTTSVTAPTSTGVRLRLLAVDLASADGFTVSVADPAEPVTVGSGPFRFTIVPVRATSVASQPDSLVQNAQPNELGLTINGGYFGPGGVPTVASFLGTTLPSNSTATPSTARQLNLVLPSALSSSNPGLYQLTIANGGTPAPVPNNPSVTNLAIFPDYQTNSPSVALTVTNGLGGALTNASAIAIDPQLGVAAVAVTGADRVEFFKIGNGTLTPIGTTATVHVPSSLSINTTLHTVAVVSFKDQQVAVFPVPSTLTAGTIVPTTTISLAGLIPAEQTPLPVPYSVGVDSDTNMALVAFSSSSNPTTANVGFLLDLNADSQTCLSSAATPPCVFAQVTLNTGVAPQIAMLPHTHLAVVTPGGLGIVSGIDVTKASSTSTIASVSLTSGLVTVTTTAAHNLNPGNPGTVLILNVPKGTTNQTDFNGAFTVQSVLNATSFTYALTSTVNDTATGVTSCASGNPPCSTASYSPANISIGGIAQTSQGVAVNQITGLVAIADPNATGTNGPQINLLSSLDQNITSISLRAGCTFYTTSCPGAAELLGTNSVAFQPFSNSLVSYNAAQNQLSVSDPVTAQRYAFVQLPSGSGTFALGNLNLVGGLAADPATNQALVVQSGSSSILLVNLGPVSSNSLKPVQIIEVLVPSADGKSIGGIPGGSLPQGTLTSNTALANVKIFGSGFSSGAVVRLDGNAISTPAPVSDREIDITIPASFLSGPHRYALDVVSGGVQSNASDFIVVQAVDFSKVCKDSSNNFVNTKPSSVAIADQLKLAGYAPIAVVSNNGCNSVSVVDIAPTLPTFDNTGHLTGFAPNPTFGTILHTIAVGTGPQGVAVSPRFGLAVVANNGAGTASIVDLIANNLKVADVTTGTGPIGAAINEGTGAALVANTSSNTVSEINLGLLFGSSPATSLTATTIGVDTEPIAIAVDPDRGTNNNGLAVVTALALSSSTFPHGVLDSVDIGASTPAKSTTAQVGSVTLTPTGVVFDPSVSPALFYAVSSGGNVVSSFDPDSGASTTVHVGINPTSLAINPQTGGILTVNSISNTISIIDTLSSPFRTRRSYGIPGSPQLGVAIDQFLNIAVIVDQANNRVLLFPMPN